MSTTPLTESSVATPTDTLSAGADERRLLRSGLIAGLLYAVGIGFAIWFLNTTHPAFDAGPLDAATGFRDNAWQIAAGTVLFLLPLPFVLMFLGGLHSVLRPAGAALATVALGAGLLDIAVFGTGTVASSITSTIGMYDASAAAGAVIKAVDGILPVAVTFAGLLRAVLLGASTILLRRRALIGRGLARFGWIVAGLGVVGIVTIFTAATFPLTELAMILSWVWIALLAARLPRRVQHLPATLD